MGFLWCIMAQGGCYMCSLMCITTQGGLHGVLVVYNGQGMGLYWLPVVFNVPGWEHMHLIYNFIEFRWLYRWYLVKPATCPLSKSVIKPKCVLQ